MEGSDLILAALAAGGTAAVGQSATLAVNSAHTALRERLRQLFSRHPQAPAALDLHEQDPDAFAPAIRSYLAGTGADCDEQALRAAAEILRSVDPAGSASGKYRVDVGDSQGVQIGDFGNQQNTFGARPAGAE
ncbi:hypothetical protein SSP531S_57250 [Streptomyces spongiicola]|uniref:RHIM domain-containing protein n=1 Tax=Streptomyces spongiicola TaxID=1690221 RepID=A0A2S1Z0T0_9ACTN|nr:hypothetical protein [Streptomyces spongiicola]AWK09987.1 hypothetical protein DDQ41_14980 [Streptomyces spongiicola]GBQ04233.1 hypothetical protein SSP531S_57250 [Streptomyces spongiicola]